MADFGIDLSALPDLSFGLKSGRENLAEAIARRLITPLGSLFYDPNYGLDLRQYLNEALTDEVRYEIETLAATECEKDERVLAAEVKLIDTSTPRTLQLAISLETAEGPFRLILAINAVTVEVLRA
jgi:phage baseplate assembly protein W